MGKIFKCDIKDCPEWRRCLDKDELAVRCPMYRMLKRDLPVHKYDKQAIEVNGKRYNSKSEAARAMGIQVSDLNKVLETNGSKKFGDYNYSLINEL